MSLSNKNDLFNTLFDKVEQAFEETNTPGILYIERDGKNLYIRRSDICFVVDDIMSEHPRYEKYRDAFNRLIRAIGTIPEIGSRQEYCRIRDKLVSLSDLNRKISPRDYTAEINNVKSGISFKLDADKKSNNYYLNLLAHRSWRSKEDLASAKSAEDVRKEMVKSLLDAKTKKQLQDIVRNNRYIFGAVFDMALNEFNL